MVNKKIATKKFKIIYQIDHIVPIEIDGKRYLPNQNMLNIMKMN